MNRSVAFNSPFLLGFESLERLVERTLKSANDAYPPYNIEELDSGSVPDGSEDGLRLTLAVAGFSADELAVTVEENQLVIRGKQGEAGDRNFLHRGIAARQFQRAFVLADGIEVTGADLENGLLRVELKRPKNEPRIRRIEITTGKGV
jgi:HSP20 family molecular chaperone IbpA